MSSKNSFEEELQGLYTRYRRKHLKDQLDDLAAKMEETLFHKAVGEAFFDEQITIEEDVKQTVEDAVSDLEAENYDKIEEELEDVKQDIERAETVVDNRIQELRINREDTVTAMRRLNERVERVDSSQVQALESLLDNWDWRAQVYTGDAETFEEYRNEAQDFGEDMARVFDQLKEDLFGEYSDTELRPLVDKLLDDDRLRLADLSETERKQLAESDLADHIELKLS